jgi:hypothetical protein
VAILNGLHALKLSLSHHWLSLLQYPLQLLEDVFLTILGSHLLHGLRSLLTLSGHRRNAHAASWWRDVILHHIAQPLLVQTAGLILIVCGAALEIACCLRLFLGILDILVLHLHYHIFYLLW